MTGKQKQYTNEEIQRTVDAFHRSGMSLTGFSAIVSIPKSTLQNWVKRSRQKIALRLPKHKQSPHHSDVEEDLYSWYLEQRIRGMYITCENLRYQALQIAEAKGISNFKASHGWITRFKTRRSLAVRKNKSRSRSSRHLGRWPYTTDDIAKEEQFLDRIVEVVGLGKVPHDRIYNFDQIRLMDPVAPEEIATERRCKKAAFTIALTVRADGVKFPAAIVFKDDAETGIFFDRVLPSFVVPRNVFVFRSVNSMWTENLDNLWIQYTFSKEEENTLLIRGRFPVHKMKSSGDLLEERNVIHVLIPAGKTTIYQPLTVGVNRQFKTYYEEEYFDWRLKLSEITKKVCLTKPSFQDYISMISRAWEKVSAETIRNAFRTAQIIEKTSTDMIFEAT